MARRPSTSTLGFLAVVALAALGGWILVTRTVLPALDTMRFGFPVDYTSSRLVVDGEWSPDVPARMAMNAHTEGHPWPSSSSSS